MIVKAAKVVPSHDHECGLSHPVLVRTHDRVDLLHRPVLAETGADRRMFVSTKSDQPAHGRKFAVLHIRDELRIGFVD